MKYNSDRNYIMLDSGDQELTGLPNIIMPVQSIGALDIAWDELVKCTEAYSAALRSDFDHGPDYDKDLFRSFDKKQESLREVSQALGKMAAPSIIDVWLNMIQKGPANLH